jgi:hypothetical protein
MSKIIVPWILPKSTEKEFVWTYDVFPSFKEAGLIRCRILRPYREVVGTAGDDFRYAIDMFRENGWAIPFSLSVNVQPCILGCYISLELTPVNFWEEVTHKLHIIPVDQLFDPECYGIEYSLKVATGEDEDDVALLLEPIE